MGEIYLDLKYTNFVDPYHHMSEKCPTIGPSFKRPDKC